MNKFSQNLKAFRLKRNMSVRAFSQALSIPYTTYSNYEAGGEPKIDTLIKIADYLNVSIDTLLGYTPNEYEYYKQWLLSSEAVIIDDSSEPITVNFYFTPDNNYKPFYDMPGTLYAISIPNKENFIAIVKFIKHRITMGHEIDTLFSIIFNLKHLHEIALKPPTEPVHPNIEEDVCIAKLLTPTTATIPQEQIDKNLKAITYERWLQSERNKQKSPLPSK